MMEKKLDLDFEYPVYDVCIDQTAQQEKLDCCEIDANIYDGYADITHFAVETILAAKRGGASINGSVHVSQEFEQRSPIRLGETLTMRGTVSAVDAVAKGDMITSRFEVCRPNGEVPLVLQRSSLRADPNRMSGPRPAAKTKTTQQPAGLKLLSRHQLKPENVARYSGEADNLIHSDPVVARQFGFDAPIAGGLMAVRYMMAHLWRAGPVSALKMSVRFRRPMFWDDELLLHGAGVEHEQLVMIRARDNKVANDATVHSITYA